MGPGKACCRSFCFHGNLLMMTTVSPSQVVTRCFQLMASVFEAPPTVAVPYIRALGPPLVRFLQVLMPNGVIPELKFPSVYSCFGTIFKGMKMFLLFRRLKGVVRKLQRT